MASTRSKAGSRHWKRFIEQQPEMSLLTRHRLLVTSDKWPVTNDGVSYAFLHLYSSRWKRKCRRRHDGGVVGGGSDSTAAPGRQVPDSDRACRGVNRPDCRRLVARWDQGLARGSCAVLEPAVDHGRDRCDIDGSAGLHLAAM